MISGVKRVPVAGLCVDAIPTLAIVVAAIERVIRDHQSFLVTFINPGTTVLARREKAGGMFSMFDLVGPDGIAMVKAIHWLHHVTAIRVSFDSTSLAPAVFALAAKYNSRVVLCGGRPGVAVRASQQLLNIYPTLNIVGNVHGYTARTAAIMTIRHLNPDIVICGMGGLLQETFLLALNNAGWTGLGCTCGGYLDQLAHGFQYYPKLIDRWNLRWAYRLAMEPRRLWRRYLLDYPKFALSVGKAMITKKTRNT